MRESFLSLRASSPAHHRAATTDRRERRSSYMAFDRVRWVTGTAAADGGRAPPDRRGRRTSGDRHDREQLPPAPSRPGGASGFGAMPSVWNIFGRTTSRPPAGGTALPLPYTVLERPRTRSCRPTRSGGTRCARLRQKCCARKRRTSDGNAFYFPQVLRDARQIGEYYPGLSPTSPACMDKLGVALAHSESKCQNFYDAAEVERVFYPEMEKLLLDFFPGATDALVYNQRRFNKE